MVRRFLAHIRLLPAVMALGATLFVVKIVGIVHDARAQDYAAAPATAETTAAAEADDAETSGAEMDVLTSLSKRRSELDARARDLQTQQELMAAAEKRLDDKIASLKALQSGIQALLGERDTAEQKQIDALVKTYASMRPRDAARIFDLLSDDVLLDVASRMKPDVLGAILAQMQPETARKLTVRLANRLTPADVSTAQTSPPVPRAVTALPPAANLQQAAADTQPATAAAATPAAAAPAASAPDATKPQDAAGSNAAPSSAK
jgi:flagellar motility protein MotE (MotC chaperone)